MQKKVYAGISIIEHTQVVGDRVVYVGTYLGTKVNTPSCDEF